MYDTDYRYTSTWTDSFESFLSNEHMLVNYIRDRMKNYDTYAKKLPEQVKFLHDNFFSANKLLEHLR